MACIEKIYSVSALVGKGVCNGNCAFCAGKYLRPDAKNTDPAFLKNLESAIKLSARHGGWSLSLTSSGEPTMSPEDVTEALRVYAKCANHGAYFPNVNLFTNGILLGDSSFCETWLPLWRELGLTNIALSIHSVNRGKQARAYGLEEYPEFTSIVANVRKYGIGVRATLLLRKGEVDNALAYERSVRYLIEWCDITNITSWPVADPDGTPNVFTPSEEGMNDIRAWLTRYTKLCHGHVWGGGVFDYDGSILRLTDYVTRHDPEKDFVRQLVVFQDGTVAYSWIKEGALCMK
ncbi:MAG TPA: radical SAM protein [Candidatus Paceibacterota bacterium]|nr:radical SAM protein [Candidatus Paceibacterota bacterium]